jgi:CRP/FNR family cyclic AMP-dependent transcriptional regulator
MAHPTPAELSAIPLFESLSEAELRAIAPAFAVRAYPKDAIVATEGDRLEMFNIVLSGRVQFFWRDESGHQVKLGIDGPGGHFADVTLTGEPILMFIIVLEDLRVASIPIAEVRALARRHPGVAVALLDDVVARLRRLVQRTKGFTMEGVYGRVVQLLLANATERDGVRVVERLSQAEIGQRVSATREMVGRILRDLARGGHVEIARGRITLLRDPPKRW